MRRIFCILALLLICILPAQAANVHIMLNGTELSTQPEPCIQAGSTFVPLRDFVTAVDPGCTVSWNGSTRQATVTGSSCTLTLTADSKYVTLNGVRCAASAASWISPSGKFMAPVRLLSLVCGADVSWSQGSVVVRTGTGSPLPNWTDEDLYWLTHIIWAESGGEPLESQVAVGNVIMNRLASKQYPNTVYGVIFDTKYGVQFSPTVNGTIYNTPGDVSAQAALLVLKGASGVGNSLFFFNPALTQASWIRNNCTYVATIGSQQFYR